ncbi:MAG: CBS domain-containing protein, partial [Marinirhabdus sp.]
MAIKSYVGKRAKPNKGPSENIKVSDYMNRAPITFTPDQNVVQVMDTLIKKKISGGPVVDHNH